MPRARPSRGPVTLLTDFGTRDGYAAAMRGVIASIAPDVQVHDAAHDIAPGDVAAASACLERYWQIYPPGTIHVVVVDPGVGGTRAALAVESGDRLLVGPDNGVLSATLAVDGARVHTIAEPRYLRAPVSATFHGRDIFAPAAAHLALGLDIAQLGPPSAAPVRLSPPAPERGPDGWRGSVVEIDRFGNLITNLPGTLLSAGARVRLGKVLIGEIRRTYAEVRSGEAVAVIGSDGRLEIAVRDGSAAQRFRAARGAEVRIEGTEG
jgi:S-adenosyl-L-methionine hydrolase (adenosine-forming)